MVMVRAHSLRARLVWLLLGAIVLVATIQFFIAYRTALNEADEIFDYHMQQMALALQAGLPVSPSSGLRGSRRKTENADFLTQIWTTEGVRVFESDESDELPQLAALGFSYVRARGTTYRVLSIQTASQTIQVAQDEAARRQIARRLALRTAAPTALMAPLLMLLVLGVISRSLRPVARARRQLAERQASDLSPVSEAGLPDEIRPLVTELNLLFKRVQEAFDSQQNFVADAAHELRSPLAALKLQVQGLQRAGDDEARQVAVGRLWLGIERATRLVEQLLVLARQAASETGRTGTGVVSLTDVCQLAMEDTIEAAHERKIDLGLSHADNISIEGHHDALRIMIRNLLENAIKYCPDGGRVDLELRAVDGAAQITVDDNGPGIPIEHRERVLDRFYRVNGTETAGSGLGLAIVKVIAVRHGAELTLDESTGLGGLRVKISFPASTRL